MVILLEPHPPVNVQDLASAFLGKEIFVGWPHLTEGKVISIMDQTISISKDSVKTDNRVFAAKSKTVVDQ